MKLRQRKDGPEIPVQRTNHQFSVEWRRRKPTPLLTALERLVDRLKEKKRPVIKCQPRESDYMVEVALYDLHVGLLSWRPETGENYDVAIARRIMADAISQTVLRTKPLKPEYYLLPIGNDFFHINNPEGLTPRNANRLDVDTRLAHIFEEGGIILREAIDALVEVAPVKIIWIPGNHDPQTSYYLLHVLAAAYENDERVEVDVSPKPRKIHIFGINMIGFMHGCDIATSKEKALPGILADEAGDDWASGQYREIHRGHTHKKAELWFAGVDTHGGVVVRTIPSLVGTDYWHVQKGFVKTSKTAQFFVWNKNYGLESVQDVHVDASFYSHEHKSEK